MNQAATAKRYRCECYGNMAVVVVTAAGPTASSTGGATRRGISWHCESLAWSVDFKEMQIIRQLLNG